MDSFLKVVAYNYNKRYSDLSRFTFVMPNKRSGSFLAYRLKGLSVKPLISPRILTISDFIAASTPLVEDSRIDMMFRLYECYREVAGEGAGADMTFEKFSSWGETILSDFNEVDMHMVPAQEVFKNVSDLNDIRSSFLTDEQKQVMVDYFGYSPEIVARNERRFWQEFNREDGRGAVGGRKGLKKKFTMLWQLLGPLYEKFKERLKADGLTTTGGAYRDVAERIEDGYEPFAGEKIVFVGFNALSESERRIFKMLKGMKVDVGLGEEPKADFIWDRVSPVLAGADDPAVKFVNANMRDGQFAPPAWIAERLERSVPTESPDIEIIAVPSNVMQAKVAGMRLKEIAAEVGEDNIKGANVAVVLPDESMLLPMLYSLPKEYPNPNLTMGFPLRHTPVISFAALLKRLHRRSRLQGGEAHFFFQDVKDLLGHPYAHLLFMRKDIRKYIDENEKKRRIMVGAGSLETLGEAAGLIFRYLDRATAPEAVADYILSILAAVKERLQRPQNTYLRSNLEKIYIATYTDAIIRLKHCLEHYRIEMEPETAFQLAERMIAGETVAFEGEPLEGLQIMGVLETRCLDFERIVMLSVNEKVMPRVGRNSTFIPNALRYAFGMPPANYQEEIFAYYFFRLLGRSRKAILTYDSRSSENRNPGASRYLLQMKYLPANIKISETEIRMGMPEKPADTIEIKKDEAIAERLKRYDVKEAEASGTEVKNISASALNHYCDCQLKFLFNDLLELYVEPEKLETIGAIDMGSIVHKAIENIYIPDKNSQEIMLKEPVVVTEQFLLQKLNQQLPSGESLIESEARKAILIYHFGYSEKDTERLEKGELSGSAAIIVDYIVEYIRNILLADMAQAPFRLWGCEIKRTYDHRLPDGRKIRIKMVIDRLDQAGTTEPGAPFRIVDYKTGGVHLKAAEFEDIFAGEYESKHILQLLLYAETFLMLIKEGKIKLPEGVEFEEFERNLQVAIYGVTRLPDLKGIESPKICAMGIKSVGDLRAYEQSSRVTFLESLGRLIGEILDPSGSFVATPSESGCLYCDYKLRCEMLRSK